ncbi:MAG: hypothetical protein KAV42_04255 [Candidatus Krumholzibacteria bacterium]|nr:hypothetical protein [Candidatus Krumholzibacteria bacterium]
MRYFIAISLILFVISASAPAFAAGQAGAANYEMYDWAVKQSNAMDKNWEDAVSRSSGGRSTTMAPVYNGRSRVRHRRGRGTTAAMSRIFTTGGSSRTGSSRVNTGGFIHKGIRSDYFSLSTRKRSGATRGNNMPKSPASARLKGMRRAPFNSANFNRSFTTGSNRTMRKSPRMGTRRGGTSRTRSTVSSGRLGASRARRRR